MVGSARDVVARGRPTLVPAHVSYGTLSGKCYTSPGVVAVAVLTTDEIAIRLLHATREQLHTKPVREVRPIRVARRAGINPYRLEYVEAITYLREHGYIEPYPNSSPGFYRVTKKGLEEILSSP